MSHAESPLTVVTEALAAHGMTDRVMELTTDVPTAAAAAEQLGCPVGAIANSLIFRAGDEPVLVLASGGHRVDVAAAGALAGVEKLRRADPELVFEATGQRVGGVAPIGHPSPLRTVLDEDLAGYERLWAGGGVAHAMFWATYDELLALTGARPAKVGA